MKRLAIIFGILLFAQSAFAGGTVLWMNGGYADSQQQTQPVDPNATLYTADGAYGDNQVASSKTETKRKFRFGRGPNYSDPNVYWNFGRVNFGSGFSSVGGSEKKF